MRIAKTRRLCRLRSNRQAEALGVLRRSRLTLNGSWKTRSNEIQVHGGYARECGASGGAGVLESRGETEMVEEAGSPFADRELVSRMGEDAVRLARVSAT
jgi:hypothetical protein